MRKELIVYPICGLSSSLNFCRRLFFSLVKQDFVVGRFHRRLRSDHHLGAVFMFQLLHFMAFVVEEIVRDIEREMAFNLYHILAAGPGLDPSQVKQRQGLDRSYHAATLAVFAHP